MERRASNKYYKNVKRAENAYAQAASRRSKALMGHAAQLGIREKDDSLQQTEAVKRLAQVRQRLALKEVTEVKKTAERALNRQHTEAREYRVAKRHAWHAITAKETAKIAADK